MKIFLNGEILNAANASVSVLDHGLLYGFGLFETLRAYSGRLFLFEEHARRLFHSAALYEIESGKTTEELRQDVIRTLEANGLSDAYVRITLTGGNGGLGLHGEVHEKPTWIIMAKPLGPISPRKKVAILHTRRSSPEGKWRAKSLSFANNMLAKKELSRSGLADAEGLFLNEMGYLVEGVVSNLFFVRGGKIFTPHADTGLLPGVTRAFVMKLCRRLGLPVQEGFYRPEDLFHADEAFLTNSVQEIVAISEVDGRPFPAAPGQITFLLAERYRLAVREQTDTASDRGHVG
jgi:4-amino-4-deoxychorismate lyase